ncbi:MAG TPA: bifunctional DNA-formamidopyrimidine glycosylase/DNA-(apurinic or apyrimidinic site) lyase [Candidatus Eremiobacteraceae bacterium]|nr:bifunctional DNA-formamidopyrimidine glycosylase/DNA-(apurinic or apyrimidinic site) lyase [Candidatus Eremiobacteraceae bacterium]
MPELPEVETIARGLARSVSGRTIKSVDVRWPRTVDPRGLAARALKGETIAAVRRLGKYVLFDLSSGRHAAVHLRMTGRLIADPPAELPHTRLTLRFEDGGALVFSDARKFGRWRLFEGDPQDTLGVGIDPFDPALTPVRLRELLRGRRTAIKTWLLDQRRLSGVGNIYACEALYRARIRPSKPAGRLTLAHAAALLSSLRKVLRNAIFHRGSSVDDYVDGAGMPGGFQKKLAVYGRGGLPCRRCKTAIRRVVLAQRGTFFCPVCQH